MPKLYLFVLGGALLWGVTNTLKSFFLRTRKVSPDTVVVATMAGAAVFSFGAEFVLNGVPRVTNEFWVPFGITTVINVFTANMMAKAMQLEDAGVVVPLSATMPLFALVTSWVILGEWPTQWGYVGIGLISAGSYVLQLRGAAVATPTFVQRCIALAPRQHQAIITERVVFWLAPWIRIASSRGAQLAFLVACLSAVTINFDKLAVLHSSPMIFTGGVFGVVALLTYVRAVMQKTWETDDTSAFLPLLALGLLIGLMTVMMNAGYYYGIAPYVGALKRTSILWTVILATVFLNEQYLLYRGIGALVIFAGVVAMAF